MSNAICAKAASEAERSLQNLGLTGKRFTGECFQHWQRRVHSLNRQGSGVRDETLKCIANLGAISGLSLKGTSISDVGIQHLKRFGEFDWLDVSNTQVTAEGLISAQLKCRFIDVGSGQFRATELHALSARYQVGIDEPHAYY